MINGSLALIYHQNCQAPRRANPEVMRQFEKGDRVRVDIPDRSDPDHDRLHGMKGTVVDIIEDDAGQETGDPRDSHIFLVETQEGDVAHLRWRDVRPASDQ